MSVIERCHFVAYSFVFPALSSLSAMRCIVTARRPHSSTPTLQNTNNQEDPSIPRPCLVDPRAPTRAFSFRLSHDYDSPPFSYTSPYGQTAYSLCRAAVLYSSPRRFTSVIRLSLPVAIDCSAIAYKRKSCYITFRYANRKYGRARLAD